MKAVLFFLKLFLTVLSAHAALDLNLFFYTVKRVNEDWSVNIVKLEEKHFECNLRVYISRRFSRTSRVGAGPPVVFWPALNVFNAVSRKAERARTHTDQTRRIIRRVCMVGFTFLLNGCCWNCTEWQINPIKWVKWNDKAVQAWCLRKIQQRQRFTLRVGHREAGELGAGSGHGLFLMSWVSLCPEHDVFDRLLVPEAVLGTGAVLVWCYMSPALPARFRVGFGDEHRLTRLRCRKRHATRGFTTGRVQHPPLR